MTLQEYKENCKESYKGITLTITNGKQTISRKMYKSSFKSEKEIIDELYKTLYFHRND